MSVDGRYLGGLATERLELLRGLSYQADEANDLHPTLNGFLVRLPDTISKRVVLNDPIPRLNLTSSIDLSRDFNSR